MPDNNVDIMVRLRGARKAQADARATGRAVGDIGDKQGHVANQSAKADKAAGKSRRSFALLGTAAKTGGLALGAGLAAGAYKSVTAFEESRKVVAQTNAVLRSTRGVSNVTAGGVDALTNSMMRKTGIDDEAIRQGANMLLTFTNIRNEAGKNNKVFDQSTKAATDMAVALGTDSKTAAMQLGKALNDPAKGMTRLQRSGVTFTDQQKDQVKALQDSGNMLGAQKIILAEVNKEFRGSAAAQATPLSKLRTTIGELAETVGSKLAPLIDRGATALNNFLGSSPGIAGITNFFRSGSGGARTFGASFRTIRGVVTDARRAFRGLGPEFAAIGRHLARSGQFALAVIRRVLPGVRTAFRGVFQIIRGAVQIIGGILRGDFRKVWEGVKNVFSGALKVIAGLLRTATAPFREAGSRLGQAVWNGMKSGGTAVLNFFINKINDVIGVINKAISAFNKLPGDDIGAIGEIPRAGGGPAGGNRTPRPSTADRVMGNASTSGSTPGIVRVARRPATNLSGAVAAAAGGGNFNFFLDGAPIKASVERRNDARKARR